jgi:hypothetical protein
MTMAACFSGTGSPSETEPPTVSTTPTTRPDLVELSFHRFDFEQNCWCGVLRDLDFELWAAYAAYDTGYCYEQLYWTAATSEGWCITFGHDCGGVPNDPWLEPCETVTGCCDLDIHAYATCQDIFLECEEDTGSASP